MTMPRREHSRAWAWTRDFTIGLALALVCAVVLFLLAGQMHRLLRADLNVPRATGVSAPAPPTEPATATSPSAPAQSSPASSSTAQPPMAQSPPAQGSSTPSVSTGADSASSQPSLALPDGSSPKTPAPSAEARAASPEATAADIDAIVRELQDRRLTVPIPGLAATKLARGSFREERTGHPHEALDILAPRGTPIIAVEDGRIEKLFWSDAGGHTIYQFDPAGRVAYYYAHLDRYAPGLAEGQTVRRGDTIGYVGSSGNARADAPHLHFAIFLLTSQRQWWKGTAIDPYPVFVPPA